MKKKLRLSTAYVAKIAMLSALAFVLYMYGKFNLPFMFPQFLEMQFSELPALLAGFSMGPVAGALVIIIKCLIKFPFSSTMYVGELMDIILGLFFVLPASIIYGKNKTKKNAVIGLVTGTLTATALSLVFNRFIAIPLYVNAFHIDFDTIVGMLAGLYPKINENNFYNFLYIRRRFTVQSFKAWACKRHNFLYLQASFVVVTLGKKRYSIRETFRRKRRKNRIRRIER